MSEEGSRLTDDIRGCPVPRASLPRRRHTPSLRAYPLARPCFALCTFAFGQRLKDSLCPSTRSICAPHYPVGRGMCVDWTIHDSENDKGQRDRNPNPHFLSHLFQLSNRPSSLFHAFTIDTGFPIRLILKALKFYISIPSFFVINFDTTCQLLIFY